MTNLLGRWTFNIRLVSKQGLRCYTDVDIVCELSPEQANKYRFSLVATTDVLEKWGIDEDKIETGLLPLVREMYDGSINMKINPPAGGYWFDGGNTADTIHETANLMRNGERVWFLQNPAEEDQLAAIFGGAIMSELEHLDQTFVAKTGQHLLHKPDRAYVRSKIVRMFSTEPKDDDGLLGKIASMNVVIDSFGIKKSGSKATGSLDGLCEWLAEEVGEGRRKELTATFYHLRGLRNQFPLHFQFDSTGAVLPVERSRVQAAAKYFGFRSIDSVPGKWKKICDKVDKTITELENLVKNT